MSRRPTQPAPEANAKPNVPEVEEPFRESRCDCCRFSDIGGAHGETGYQLARNVTLCSYCKLLFPQIRVPKVDLSEAELLGAWGYFTEDIKTFHCNVSHHARSWRVDFEDLLPNCLHDWLVGSKVESAAQQSVMDILWPLMGRERVLRLIEVAAVLADDYDHEVEPDTLRQVVTREDVAPVWLSWIASNAAKGKASTKMPGYVGSQWASYGEAHIEHSLQWAATLAKERLLQDKNKKK